MIRRRLRHMIGYMDQREAHLQELSVPEIAEQMKPVDVASLELPTEFARAIGRLLEDRRAGEGAAFGTPLARGSKPSEKYH